MKNQFLRVLVVENDRDDFLFIRDLLDEIATLDCEIQWAATYRAAKAAIAEKIFDVCLVACSLGERTGIELLRQVSAEGFRAPVILLDGQNERAVDLEAMSAGAADYLNKGEMTATRLERAIRYAVERRRAQQILEKAAKRERAMIDNAPDVICTIDAAGRFVTINPACLKMWGYQPAELVGRQYVDFVAPGDVLKTNEAAQRSLSGEEVVGFENCFRHKNGTFVNLIWTYQWLESERLVFGLAHDITERKRAEEAIRLSEEKHRNILENIEEGYFETDISGKFTFFNDALCDSLGYTRNELMGLYYKEYVDEENAKKLNDIFIDVYKTNQSGLISNWEIIRKDGERRMHESPVSLIRNAANEPIGFRGLVRDITERRRAEDKLQESELRYRRLFENNPNPIWVYEVETLKFLTVNEEAVRHYGYSHEEFQKLTIKELHLPEDLAILQKYVAQAAAGVEQFHSVRHQKKDGTIIEVEIAIQPVNFSGRRARLAMLNDVTKRKRAEEALAHENSLMQALMDNIPDGIYFKDTQSRFLRVSKHINLKGIESPEEAVGKTDFDFFTEEHARAAFEDEQRIVQTGEPLVDKIEKETFRDGTIGWVSSTKVPIFDAQGNVSGIVGTSRDITERKRTEELIHESEEKYRNILASIEEGYFEIDLKGNFTFFNDALFSIIGYEKDEAWGMNYRKYVDRANGKKLFANFIKIFKTGKPVRQLNWEITHKDKTKKFVESSISLIRDAAREPIGFRGLVRDITERQLTEAVLEAAARRESAMIENALDVICTIDGEGFFTSINPACFRMWGYQPEELIGRRFIDFVAPADVAKTMAVDASILSGKEATNFENRYIHKNGTLVDVRWTAYWSESEQLMFAVAHDITERRRAEEVVQNSRDYLNQIINAVADPIFVMNRRHQLTLVNDAFCRVTGCSREQAIGKTSYDLFSAEEADIFWEKDELVFTTGAENINEEQFTDLQGNAHCIIARKRLHIDKDGEKFIVGVSRDIAETKKTEETLRANEATFRDLFDNAPIAYHELDTHGCFTRINHTEELLLGYTNEELKGRHCSEIIVEKDSREATTAKIAGTMPLQAVERTFIRKDGTLVPVLNEDRLIYDAAGVLTGIRSTLQDITERKRIEEQLLHDAFHDGLTGLANRTLFTEHLQMTIERGKRDRRELFAVLFLDFDRFKVINDSLGHAEGDNLLKQIAVRLNESLRSGDLVARIGGDEFTILLNKMNDSSAVLQIAERIQKSLEIPFEIGGGEVFTSASIGIALSTSEHDKAEDMLRDADIAMYRAKAKGKAQYQVFDQAMHEQALVRLRIETEMRQAIERKEFCLHYQPIFSLAANRAVGFESLVRWKHPKFGVIPPNDFISIAEENGLIIPLGQWILHESCRQMRRWQINNPSAASLTVSVNLSFKQFLKHDLAEQVAATLAETGLDPKCLKLEITESHLMENGEKAIVMMNRLCALGVELSLDDFGTGYSSLSYLHRLPVSFLKIDRSFVMRMIESEENSEIVRTIIKLAQNLKMQVIAEGIETAEQLAQLKTLNCEYGQGYFFAKPLEAAAAETLINKSPENPAYFINQPKTNAASNGTMTVRKKKAAAKRHEAARK